MLEKPKVIKGGSYNDHRGVIRFVNDFCFDNIKRFYFIKHPDTSTVRAWQGHPFEKKYFYPISGSFIIAWVKIDSFKNPSKDLLSEYYILSAANSEILSIPKGYANGLKALEPDSEIMIFSDMNLEKSVKDEVRFPPDWWLDWSKF
jgi:dTDP-4-dehydrorhamnose 3,5-epimerase-like enzyme